MVPRNLYRFLPILMFCPLLATADLRDEIDTCARISDDTARLACFDRIAGSHADVPASQPRPITAEVGMDREAEKAEQEKVYTVNVTDCEASGTSRRLFFTLENGQIWQQKNDKWMSTRNCKSSGTITKDFFGYKLYIEKMDQTIRVSRIR